MFVMEVRGQHVHASSGRRKMSDISLKYSYSTIFSFPNIHITEATRKEA